MIEAELQPTQKKIMALLSDGEAHTRKELHSCLSDDLAHISAIHKHLTRIRRVIRPKGMDILCVLMNRKLHYRLVRLITRGE